MGAVFDWNSVYGMPLKSSSSIYEKKIKKNKEFYLGIKREDYQTIDACVAHAIEHGNHAAFAKYYIKVAKSQKEIFSELFHSYYERIKERELDNDYHEWIIMKSDFWCASNIAFSEEGRYTYKYNKNKKRNTAIDSWAKGIKLPPKYAVVQLGFYLDLNLDEVNQLLLASGNEMLYVLDVVDAICMFYMNYFQQDDNKEVPYTDRLNIVKQTICSSVKSGEDMFFISKKTKATESSGYEHPKVLAYKYPIGWNIDNRITEICEKLEDIKGNLDDVYKDNPFYLTMFYEKQLEESKDIETFLKQRMFGILRYGYLKQRDIYFNKNKYHKNLYYTDYELTKDVSLQEIDDTLTGKENLNFIHPEFEEIYDQVMAGTIDDDLVIKVLNSIWLFDDLILGESVDFNRKKPSGFSVTKVMRDGRDVGNANSKEYILPKINDTEKVKNAYLFSLGNKNHLIKFCTAAGMEDQIGLFLRLSNYWPKDYIKKEADVVERTDALIIYTMRFRDKLIESWSLRWKEEMVNSGRNAVEFKKKIKDAFPMIRLLMTVSRDIQLVSANVSPVCNVNQLTGDLIYEISHRCIKECDFILKKTAEEKKAIKAISSEDFVKKYCATDCKWYGYFCKWSIDNK